MSNSPTSPGAPGVNVFAPQSPQQTPVMSAPPSPVTPRQNLANGSHRESVDFSTEASGGGGGLGNLADELADAWDQEEDGYGYASGQDNSRSGSQQLDLSDVEDAYARSVQNMRSPSPEDENSPASRNRLRAKQRQHQRQESHYDGSDYGNDSDLDEVGNLSPALESQMADIESLVRRGVENNGSEHDHVIQRTIEALKDLGGQSGIENSAMR